jgi:hypothetical protein
MRPRRLTNCQPDHASDDGADDVPRAAGVGVPLGGLDDKLDEDGEQGDGGGVIEQRLALQDDAQPLGAAACSEGVETVTCRDGDVLDRTLLSGMIPLGTQGASHAARALPAAFSSQSQKTSTYEPLAASVGRQRQAAGKERGAHFSSAPPRWPRRPWRR